MKRCDHIPARCKCTHCPDRPRESAARFGARLVLAGGGQSFATCPITENGFLRIIGHPKYPNSPGPPSAVATSLVAIRELPGHHFWQDKISIADRALVDIAKLSNHARVTDSYLLALAATHGGKLASMDRKLTVDAVQNGAESLELI